MHAKGKILLGEQDTPPVPPVPAALMVGGNSDPPVFQPPVANPQQQGAPSSASQPQGAQLQNTTHRVRTVATHAAHREEDADQAVADREFRRATTDVKTELGNLTRRRSQLSDLQQRLAKDLAKVDEELASVIDSHEEKADKLNRLE
ncbi:hypothetical protein B0T10DRAFT_553580 [Thelonectria olida]|uniref:Uncharacterized protein n=1 Tax=Thelonectria olida TaxID=1576542 RepID=A0A9P8VPX2_9HYPO|nr:hypothetical protein B0T10DRAFT_553580 [Thelonectria olida]